MNLNIEKLITINLKSDVLDKSLFKNLKIKKESIYDDVCNEARHKLLDEISSKEKINNITSEMSDSVKLKRLSNEVIGMGVLPYISLTDDIKINWFLINKKGKKISTKKYCDVYRTINNLIVAKDKNCTYFLDKTGKNILFNYNDLKNLYVLNNRLFLLKFDKSCWVIDTKNNVKLKCNDNYDTVNINFIDSNIVIINNKILNLDTFKIIYCNDLNIIYDAKLNEDLCSNRKICYIKYKDNSDYNKMKLLDFNSSDIIATVLYEGFESDIYFLKNNEIVFRRNNKYGIVNSKKIDFIYDNINFDYNGYIIFYNKENYVVYDVIKSDIVGHGIPKFCESTMTIDLDSLSKFDLSKIEIKKYILKITNNGLENILEFDSLDELEKVTIKDLEIVSKQKTKHQ